MPNDMPPGKVEAVKNALEDKKYLWRTVDKIAHQVQLSPDRVQIVLNEDLKNQVVRTYNRKIGETLYTTREHYKRNAPLLNRVMSAMTNQVNKPLGEHLMSDIRCGRRRTSVERNNSSARAGYHYTVPYVYLISHCGRVLQAHIRNGRRRKEQ